MITHSRIRSLATAVLLLTAVTDAHAQFSSTRRMGMGGVQLLHGGPGSDAVNVAYRAVPKDSRNAMHSFSLPVGVITVLQDRPTLNPNDPNFDIYRLVDVISPLPWHIPLTQPKAPSGSVQLDIAHGSLLVNLGDLAAIIPEDRVCNSGTWRGPVLSIGGSRAFAGLAPLIDAHNDFEVGSSLHEALCDNALFTPNTLYGLEDAAQGIVAGQFMVGTSWPILAPRDSRSNLYVGARAKLLKGLAYYDIHAEGTLNTPDTLFGSAPLTATYHAVSRYAGPSGGGWGQGFDLGAVMIAGPLEFGVAANDIATSLPWSLDQSSIEGNAIEGTHVTTSLPGKASYRSSIPPSYVLTAIHRSNQLLLAADMLWNREDQSSAHCGAEWRLGSVALRGGGSLDPRKRTSFAGGLGLSRGRLGIDVAIASRYSALTSERIVDLGVGFSLLPGGNQ